MRELEWCRPCSSPWASPIHMVQKKTGEWKICDLSKAYNQIPITSEDVPKTAVIIPFGLFEFTVMTFGLYNAAQTFQSARITDRTIRQKYVWPHMHRDITKWAKNCIVCQLSKTSRHVKLLPIDFTAPDGRFDHVHMDLIGPLPPYNGF
ncbi:uncharacterized protein LOC116844898 [Odontomachus brunneus]|uniref:uncharacterized protein LOC116844898 n=1 Tax=Odontomachus brunneus TaxID=486640 RepID=UPI0013F2712E|nr:uncharacterized protein LOC116844898 [Odontomachus brunneus]